MTPSEFALTKRALTAEKTAQQHRLANGQKDRTIAGLIDERAQGQIQSATREIERIDAELLALDDAPKLEAVA